MQREVLVHNVTMVCSRPCSLYFYKHITHATLATQDVPVYDEGGRGRSTKIADGRSSPPGNFSNTLDWNTVDAVGGSETLRMM